MASRLASGRSRHVGTRFAGLASCDIDLPPDPVATAAAAAEDIDGRGIAVHDAGDGMEHQIGNGHTGGWPPRRRAIVIVLLDHDAIAGDVGHADVLEPDGRNAAGSSGDGLDANAVSRVDHGGMLDGHVAHDVIAAAADGADGQSMASRADAPDKVDVLRIRY